MSQQAFLTAAISFSTLLQLPVFAQDWLITMSISVAPFLIAFLVSNTFTGTVFSPRGKPITVQTFTFVPSSNFAQYFTLQGFTQTEAKPYWIASLQSASSWLFFAGLSKVWSIIPARIFLSIVTSVFGFSFRSQTAARALLLHL